MSNNQKPQIEKAAEEYAVDKWKDKNDNALEHAELDFIAGAEFALSLSKPEKEPYGYIFEGAFFTKKHLPPEWTYTSNEKPIPVYLKPEKEDEWIPVSERLPEDQGDNEYLVFTTTSGVDIAIFMRSDEVYEWSNYYNDQITHWRKLPSPPNPK